MIEKKLYVGIVKIVNWCKAAKRDEYVGCNSALKNLVYYPGMALKIGSSFVLQILQIFQPGEQAYLSDSV
jgi:hypothetical protein